MSDNPNLLYSETEGESSVEEVPEHSEDEVKGGPKAPPRRQRQFGARDAEPKAPPRPKKAEDEAPLEIVSHLQRNGPVKSEFEADEMNTDINFLSGTDTVSDNLIGSVPESLFSGSAAPLSFLGGSSIDASIDLFGQGSAPVQDLYQGSGQDLGRGAQTIPSSYGRNSTSALDESLFGGNVPSLDDLLFPKRSSRIGGQTGIDTGIDQGQGKHPASPSATATTRSSVTLSGITGEATTWGERRESRDSGLVSVSGDLGAEGEGGMDESGPALPQSQPTSPPLAQGTVSTLYVSAYKEPVREESGSAGGTDEVRVSGPLRVSASETDTGAAANAVHPDSAEPVHIHEMLIHEMATQTQASVVSTGSQTVLSMAVMEETPADGYPGRYPDPPHPLGTPGGAFPTDRGIHTYSSPLQLQNKSFLSPAEPVTFRPLDTSSMGDTPLAESPFPPTTTGYHEDGQGESNGEGEAGKAGPDQSVEEGCTGQLADDAAAAPTVQPPTGIPPSPTMGDGLTGTVAGTDVPDTLYDAHPDMLREAMEAEGPDLYRGGVSLPPDADRDGYDVYQSDVEGRHSVSVGVGADRRLLRSPHSTSLPPAVSPSTVSPSTCRSQSPSPSGSSVHSRQGRGEKGYSDESHDSRVSESPVRDSDSDESMREEIGDMEREGNVEEGVGEGGMECPAEGEGWEGVEREMAGDSGRSLSGTLSTHTMQGEHPDLTVSAYNATLPGQMTLSGTGRPQRPPPSAPGLWYPSTTLIGLLVKEQRERQQRVLSAQPGPDAYADSEAEALKALTGKTIVVRYEVSQQDSVSTALSHTMGTDLPLIVRPRACSLSVSMSTRTQETSDTKREWMAGVTQSAPTPLLSVTPIGLGGGDTVALADTDLVSTGALGPDFGRVATERGLDTDLCLSIWYRLPRHVTVGGVPVSHGSVHLVCGSKAMCESLATSLQTLVL
ncbi:hypothetical protein KIPB_000982 [Kipferlia bialata]|uniref:Uncharacterized protein n=1 Tax=Kipferlia bialata TaxID=797122 RepID=A0A9K3GF69_9EUKA|nr:hypothetical protein KIPB_000982 [Kipferlia bialata]|eukprot:g982.t1